MAKTAITKEWHDRLVEAFRTCPGQHYTAARAAGCDPVTARKAWELGLTRGWIGARRPIKDIIAEEQELARARMAEQQAEADRKVAEAEATKKAEDARKAREDAAMTRAAEAALVRGARGGAGQIVSHVSRILKMFEKLIPNIEQTINEMAGIDPVSGKPRILTPGEMRAVKELYATLWNGMRQGGEAAAKSIEMERVILGEPSKIVGVVTQDLTMGEASRRVEAAFYALQRLRGRNIDPDMLSDKAAMARLTDGRVIDAVPQDVQVKNALPGNVPGKLSIVPDTVSVGKTMAERSPEPAQGGTISNGSYTQASPQPHGSIPVKGP